MGQVGQGNQVSHSFGAGWGQEGLASGSTLTCMSLAGNREVFKQSRL